MEEKVCREKKQSNPVGHVFTSKTSRFMEPKKAAPGTLSNQSELLIKERNFKNM